MSDPFIGEIKMFGGNFPPNGWAICNGQLMPISENDALFVLIGTTYGGDGQETFGLPDLQSRVAVHQGTNPGTGTTYQMGEKAGVEMEAGCFNCSCGTCVVEVVSGMENLDQPTAEELEVLDAWNKDPEKFRLTCCVKMRDGDVTIKQPH